MAKQGAMSRGQSAAMFAKIEAQKAENRERESLDAAHRLTDPVEIAKTYLRQRGFAVFNLSVLDARYYNSRMVRVGLRTLTPDEVILMAESHRDRKAAA